MAKSINPRTENISRRVGPADDPQQIFGSKDRGNNQFDPDKYMPFIIGQVILRVGSIQRKITTTLMSANSPQIPSKRRPDIV